MSIVWLYLRALLCRIMSTFSYSLEQSLPFYASRAFLSRCVFQALVLKMILEYEVTYILFTTDATYLALPRLVD